MTSQPGGRGPAKKIGADSAAKKATAKKAASTNGSAKKGSAKTPPANRARRLAASRHPIAVAGPRTPAKKASPPARQRPTEIVDVHDPNGVRLQSCSRLPVSAAAGSART